MQANRRIALFGLLLFLCAAAALLAGATSAMASGRAPQVLAPAWANEQADEDPFVSVPLTTPTPIRTPTFTPTQTPASTDTPVAGLPDLTGSTSWVAACPGPVLRLQTTFANVSEGDPPAGPSTMRLQNSSGSFVDVFVPALTWDSPTFYYGCAYGSCLPPSWDTSLPFTLTVDIFNQVQEQYETNNASTQNSPPPVPCLTATPTPRPTITYTPGGFTPTATLTSVRIPDLVAGVFWTGPCPVLQFYTHYVNAAHSGWPQVVPSTMRLQNSTGDYMDIAVPRLSNTNARYDAYCPLNTCLPVSWLARMPFTVIADVFDQVGEINENNNTASLSIPPPPACNTNTPNPTLTYTPSITPTATSTATSTTTQVAADTATRTATPCAMQFTDVQPSDYFYGDVLYLFCHGAVSGYSDGTFRPYGNATRGQLTKMLVLAYDIPLYTPPQPSYCDVPADHPFYIYVESITQYLYSLGLIIGYGDCTFRPYNWTTRGQLTKLAATLACWPVDTSGGPHFVDVPAEHPFYQYIETAYNRGVISGYACGGPGEPCPGSYFRWANSVTRGQLSKVIHRAVKQGLACPTPTAEP
jgi:hypothetical protein